jgi:alpha-D-ribose 1-methylphosphonate 5-triphosphate synthase subunit PhnG
VTTLSSLAQADPAALKTFVDGLLASLSDVHVISNRTGIVMLPAVDPVRGVHFHVGEVLMAEARVSIGPDAVEGYGACIGRDLEQALAIAIADACLRAGLHGDEITRFAEEQRMQRELQDRDLMARVSATRVEMETF